MKQFVTKRKRGGKRDRCYTGVYRFPSDTKDTRVALGVADKRVAKKLLDDIVQQAQRERAGIAVPRALAEAAKRPMVDHLADFVADLIARGRVKKHYGQIEYRVGVLIRSCDWRYPADVSSDSFIRWRSQQTSSPKTRNEYLNAASSLMAWMVRHGRIEANPLAGVGKVQQVGGETFTRRAFTDAEMRRLLDVVPAYRSAVYLTAVLTGLRRNELKALEWRDVHLHAARPFIAARASTTKNRKEAAIELRDDVVDRLRDLRPAKCNETDRVFTVPKPETFRRDLDAAGISQVDEQGRKVDMHALRHTFATNCSRSNVHPQVTRQLMRHSDYRLTDRVYTDKSQFPTFGVLDQLPRYDTPEPQRMKATGTTDQRGNDGTLIGTPDRVAGRHSESQRDADNTSESEAKHAVKRGQGRELSQGDAGRLKVGNNEGDGARTRNLRIDSPVL